MSRQRATSTKRKGKGEEQVQDLFLKPPTPEVPTQEKDSRAAEKEQAEPKGKDPPKLTLVTSVKHKADAAEQNYGPRSSTPFLEVTLDGQSDLDSTYEEAEAELKGALGTKAEEPKIEKALNKLTSLQEHQPSTVKVQSTKPLETGENSQQGDHIRQEGTEILEQEEALNYSLRSEEEDVKIEETIKNLKVAQNIFKIRTQVQAISNITKEYKNLPNSEDPPPIESQVKKINSALVKLTDAQKTQQAIIKKLQMKLAVSETKVNECKHHLSHFTESFVTKEYLEGIVESITYRTGRIIQDALKDPSRNPDTHQQLEDNSSEQSSQQENAERITEQTSSHNTPAAQKLYSQIAADAIKRTAIIKSDMRQVSGNTILKELNQAHLSLPVRAVENIQPKKYRLEIQCKSAKDKEALMTAVKATKSLNEKFTISDKRTPREKIIILAVPGYLNKDYITETLNQSFQLKKKDIFFMRDTVSRHKNCKNWILQIPTASALEIVQSEGTYFGHVFCQISPHSYVPRCRRCHCIGHLTYRCPNEESCERCGIAHNQASTCRMKKACVNCSYYNRQFNTKFPTAHLPSDSDCSSYRAAYTNERERLNTLFYGQEPLEEDDYNPSEHQYEHTQYEPSNFEHSHYEREYEHQHINQHEQVSAKHPNQQDAFEEDPDRDLKEGSNEDQTYTTGNTFRTVTYHPTKSNRRTDEGKNESHDRTVRPIMRRRSSSTSSRRRSTGGPSNEGGPERQSRSRAPASAPTGRTNFRYQKT